MLRREPKSGHLKQLMRDHHGIIAIIGLFGTPLSSLSLTPKPYTLNANFKGTSSETTRPESKKYRIPLTLSVLMKLDTIIENQQEQLALLRKVLVNTQNPNTEYKEEILAIPCDSMEELEGLCQRLEENPELSKKMIYYLSFPGGYNIGDSVSRLMKKLGTKRLWSEYSLKGHKGIKAFQELVICRVLIKACLKNNDETKANEIEEAISETRKYAPNQHGGIKYKVPEQKKKQINFRVEETNSDFDSQLNLENKQK